MTEKVQRIVNAVRIKGMARLSKKENQVLFKNPQFLKPELKLWMTRDGLEMGSYDELFEEVRKCVLREH